MYQKEKKSASQLPEGYESIVEKLHEKGIDLENLCCGTGEEANPKVVCIEANLGECMQEMGQTTRGETIMVRIDEKNRKTLDAWVETGYFKSRSEAAALFISEGLKIRASELEKLNDALKQVKKAKETLRDKAKEVFGEKKNPEKQKPLR
ncbi:MAG: ribbon-helix-helix domain-containing protein [Candidatus Sifarchaeia archaeon]